ncbi:uncharacterized protein B0P05DRAFT_549644 [Gilbertella persicaria]|uniref:Uncharacterized protein n=1 Tax=Rhizopus stolonifer TaxID=4846 RepID=A0A367KST4_RHIST|nr:uncharacterized protein B0P05DRAFT_549644 [Gilbertella persicaria]KAI8071113.1 hypothetical protein B0P05DRAFT_549644 [Gilbertella persicaria]RCI05269.1 hypothetical protein CU098_013559 [Rhizopus stolonifer]
MIPEEEYGLLSQQPEEISENEQEEAIEFISYAESDDDDEDPYFMPEHNKRTSTWTFLRMTCAPIQVVRFTIPAICILTIITYTIVIGVLTGKKKI